MHPHLLLLSLLIQPPRFSWLDFDLFLVSVMNLYVLDLATQPQAPFLAPYALHVLDDDLFVLIPLTPDLVCVLHLLAFDFSVIYVVSANMKRWTLVS